MKDVTIIGAGPAGLACAAALMTRGIEATVLEKAGTVGSVWRGHYDRLHLHTYKQASGLPGLPMPREYPRYPSRDQVVAYLEAYADHFGITPEFDIEVTAIRSTDTDRRTIETTKGTRETDAVILAAGTASFPNRATWPGLDGFPGQVIHSSDYRNADAFAGQSVLVVGFGNSGGEIAMDLADHGVETRLSVRGPVNLIPRDLLGIPLQRLALLQRVLPYRVVDAINAPILRLAMGNTAKLGLPKATKGPLAQILEDGRIPLIDIGTIQGIRDGRIRICPGIVSFQGAFARFDDGSTAETDVVLLATGYRPDFRALLPDAGPALTAEGRPANSGGPSSLKGLYFCGYRVSPGGVLREIGQEAERIAADIAGVTPPARSPNLPLPPSHGEIG